MNKGYAFYEDKCGAFIDSLTYGDDFACKEAIPAVLRKAYINGYLQHVLPEKYSHYLKVKEHIKLFYLRERGEVITDSDIRRLRKHIQTMFGTSVKDIIVGQGVDRFLELTDPVKKKLVSIKHLLTKESMEDGGMFKMLRSIIGLMSFKISFMEKRDSYCVDEAMEAMYASFYFALAYNIVDDMMDSTELTEQEKEINVATLIDIIKQGGYYPADGLLGVFAEGLRKYHPDTDAPVYSDMLDIIHAQNIDRKRILGETLSMKELYIPIMIKASLTRIMAIRWVGEEPDKDLMDFSIYSGLLNQLVDDFRDFPEDMANQSFTPFTNFIKSGCKGVSPLRVYFEAVQKLSERTDNPSKARMLYIRRFHMGMRTFADKSSIGDLIEFVRKLTEGDMDMHRLMLGLVASMESVSDVEETVSDTLESNIFVQEFAYGC